jgi:hypothetical protein
VARISKKKHAAIILAVAGLLNSLLVLLAHLTEMSAELEAMLLTVGNSGIALWQAVVGANGNSSVGNGGSSFTLSGPSGTTAQARFSRASDPGPEDQRGSTRVEVVTSLFVVAISVIIFVGVLSTFMGCTTTYTGAKSRTALQAYGTSGTTAVLDVDGSEVCRVTGTQSTLRVDASTAQRICAAFAPQCTWRAP